MLVNTYTRAHTRSAKLLRRPLVLSFSLIHFNHPLAHGTSTSRAETWSDAVSPLSPSLGTSSYDARHHHPQVRDPSSGPFRHDSRDPAGSSVPHPMLTSATQSNLSRGSLGFTPFNRCRVCGPSLNFLHPLLSLMSRLFPRSRSERSKSKSCIQSLYNPSSKRQSCP